MATTGQIQDEADYNLIASMNSLSARLVDRLLADIATIIDNRRLVFDPLYFAQLEQKILNYTQELGFGNIVRDYLNRYTEIDNNILNYYSRERILIENEAINETINTEFRRHVAENLAIENVLNARALANILREQAILGMDISQAQDAIKAQQMITTDTDNTRLGREMGRIVHDAIMQYDGMQNANVAREFNLTNFYYIASVIESTRPICDHIKDTYRIVTPTDLNKILDEYCPNGVPSRTKITYETVNGVVHTREKGSGMIDGTVASNFVVNRGGYNCRHECRFTNRGSSVTETANSILDRIYGAM